MMIDKAGPAPAAKPHYNVLLLVSLISLNALAISASFCIHGFAACSPEFIFNSGPPNSIAKSVD